MRTEWIVYILRTGGDQLYTGITTNLKRRLAEHAGSGRGAKNLRGKGPLEVVCELPASDRSEASRLEARIKQLSRKNKERLINGDEVLLAQVQGVKG